MGKVEFEEAKFFEAEGHLCESLDLIRDAQRPDAIAFTSGLLAEVEYALGKPQEAIKLYMEAKEYYRRLSAPLEIEKIDLRLKEWKKLL